MKKFMIVFTVFTILLATSVALTCTPGDERCYNDITQVCDENETWQNYYEGIFWGDCGAANMSCFMVEGHNLCDCPTVGESSYIPYEGDLTISNQEDLQDFEWGFYTHFYGTLTISQLEDNTPTMYSLDRIHCLRYIETLIIEDLDTIATIDEAAFSKTVTIGTLIIRNNDNLTKVHFPMLDNLGDILIYNNPDLEEFIISTTGSAEVTSLSGDLVILDNPDLEHHGFYKLQSVAGHFILDNSAVSDYVAAFFDLTYIGGNVVIENNVNLRYCWICELLRQASPTGMVYYQGNKLDSCNLGIEFKCKWW